MGRRYLAFFELWSMQFEHRWLNTPVIACAHLSYQQGAARSLCHVPVCSSALSAVWIVHKVRRQIQQNYSLFLALYCRAVLARKCLCNSFATFLTLLARCVEISKRYSM